MALVLELKISFSYLNIICTHAYIAYVHANDTLNSIFCSLPYVRPVLCFFKFAIEDTQVCNTVGTLFFLVHYRNYHKHKCVLLMDALGRLTFNITLFCNLGLCLGCSLPIASTWWADRHSTLKWSHVFFWRNPYFAPGHHPQLNRPWETLGLLEAVAPSGGMLCYFLLFFYILSYSRKGSSSTSAHFIFPPFILLFHYDDPVCGIGLASLIRSWVRVSWKS